MSRLVARAELALICVMALGFVLIAQQAAFGLYQAGLLTVIGSTLLHIAVGNLPTDAGPMRALVLTAAILGVVAAVFGAGILLVPVLAQLGR